MSRYSLLLLVCLMAMCSVGSCQEHVLVKKNLRSDWLISNEGKYSPYPDNDETTYTIYFKLNSGSFTGDHLVIKSTNPFSVFVNNHLLVAEKSFFSMSIDSLSDHTDAMFLVAIHQTEKIDPENLSTTINSKVVVSTAGESNEMVEKKATFFRDFVVTAVLVLFIFLISVVRLNPRLSSNYFSVTKIFSLRETDDDQVYYRLTSGNILFYVFTSLILAFYLMVIGQFVETGINTLRIAGYFESLFTWFKISFIIFILLFLKLFIIYLLSSLFDVRDVAGVHFFNFISLLMVFMGLFTLILSAYYLMHGQQNGFYGFLFKFLLWLLGGWIILLFLKLSGRVQHSVFHLFSYICATEIIPFLLIVKVLNE
jgi:hypothetical protein